MSALDHFLALTPEERLDAVLKAKQDFPEDPFPATRCVSSDPMAAFTAVAPEVSKEMRSYVRLLAHFGHVDPDNVTGVAYAGEMFILALTVMRLRAV